MSGQCLAEHPNAAAIAARGDQEPTRCNESRGHRGPHRTSFGRLFPAVTRDPDPRTLYHPPLRGVCYALRGQDRCDLAPTIPARIGSRLCLCDPPRMP